MSLSNNSIIIDKKYLLKEKIGSGSFGTIYTAIDLEHKDTVALKLESVYINVPQLGAEKKIYKILNPEKGYPKIYDYIKDYKLPWGNYNILVMDCLGNSLENLFELCNRKFTLKTTIQIAIQMLQRISYCHEKSFIHRDIKPDNFLIDNNNLIHLVDFGLAKNYRDPKTHIHILYREDKKLIGTPRYVSINTHFGIEQSRRDDLESIGYILVYFLNGTLPWQGIKANNHHTKYKKIMEKKLAIPIDLLCKNLPNQFVIYFKYVRSLRFADKPDYSYLIKLFKSIVIENKIILDETYDWDNVVKSIIEETQYDIDKCSNQVENHIDHNPDITSSLQQTKNPNTN